MLHGRQREIHALDELLSGLARGRGGALVVRGEAGIGKTALLDRAVDGALRMRLLRATGVEFEMGLPFSGLHQLLWPLLSRLGDLPVPQRQALEVAFGQREGAAPDRVMIGMATLTLLSESAQQRPVLCVVDDAQWLDPASAYALAFAGRRLDAEPVVMLLALREPVRVRDLEPLPSLHLDGLPDADARALLAAVLHVPLDEKVRDRVVSESRGNPLALLELARAAGLGTLAGGFGVPVHGGGAIEDLYRERIMELPADTRRLLVVAAAEPLGDPVLLWGAARQLGIDVEAAGPAEDADLVEIDVRVRFRHPLVRSAAYRSASVSQRRVAHGALAAVTDPGTDPDRRSWHRALAATGPDEGLAAELVDCAVRVQTRGGLAAAAAFLEHAVALTPGPAERLARLLLAAEAKLVAGAPQDALGLLDSVDEAVLGPLQLAQVETLKGRIAFAVQRGMDAPAPLLRAAKRMEALNPALARAIHLDALVAVILVGSLGGVAPRHAAQAARDAVRPVGAPTGVDLLLDGLALLLTGDRREGVALLQRALSEASDDTWTRRIQLAAAMAWEVWDLDSYIRILNQQIQQARQIGSLISLPEALSTLAAAYLRRGDFRVAASMLEQARALVAVTGTAPSYPHLTLAAWSGDPGTDELVEEAIKDGTARGEGLFVAYAHFALALYRNGRGDYSAALAAAQFADAHIDVIFKGVALRELIEAAARTGDREAAEAAVAQLQELTSAAGTDFARGTQEVCAALVTDSAEAEHHFLAGLEALHRSGCLADHARAQLLYGEWLRREGRRTDARRHLREAHTALAEMGAEGFAQRAARELSATGERPRRRSPATADQLTAQELAIARLVATGATSKEVSAELFVSPRTVDAHLRNIFRKMGITSRRQLRGVRLDAADEV